MVTSRRITVWYRTGEEEHGHDAQYDASGRRFEFAPRSGAPRSAHASVADATKIELDESDVSDPPDGVGRAAKVQLRDGSVVVGRTLPVPIEGCVVLRPDGEERAGVLLIIPRAAAERVELLTNAPARSESLPPPPTAGAPAPRTASIWERARTGAGSPFARPGTAAAATERPRTGSIWDERPAHGFMGGERAPMQRDPFEAPTVGEFDGLPDMPKKPGGDGGG